MKTCHCIANRYRELSKNIKLYWYIRKSLFKYRDLLGLSLFDVIYIIIKNIESLEESPLNWRLEELHKVDDYKLYLFMAMSIGYSISIEDFFHKYSSLALVSDKYHNTSYYDQLVLIYRDNQSDIDNYFNNKYSDQ